MLSKPELYKGILTEAAKHHLVLINSYERKKAELLSLLGKNTIISQTSLYSMEYLLLKTAQIRICRAADYQWQRTSTINLPNLFTEFPEISHPKCGKNYFKILCLT